MKRISRFNIFLILFLLVFTLFSTTVFAETNSTFYDNGHATYRFIENKENVDLGYGINYQKDIAKVSATDPTYYYGNANSLGQEYDNTVNLLKIKPSKDVKLIPHANLEGSNWVRLPLSSFVENYELTHPGERVVAGINGDYFKINLGVKASTGATVSNGEFYKTPSTHEDSHNIVIKNDGFGKQFYTIDSKTNKDLTTKFTPTLTIYDKEEKEIIKFKLDKVNEKPLENEASLYFCPAKENYSSDFDEVAATDIWLINNPICSVSSMPNSFYGKGKIDSFHKNILLNNKKMFGISSNNTEINKYLKKDVLIRCQFEFSDESLKDVKNVIGFPCHLLTDGKPIGGFGEGRTENDKYRHPRTFIGQKEDGTMVLAVVDGRQDDIGCSGATGMEMAALLSYYGCVDGWNLDGGGSSTMVIRKRTDWTCDYAFRADLSVNDKWWVVNSPSGSTERLDGNCLLVVVKAPIVNLEIDSLTTNKIRLNVILLTDLEKYNDLYIMINNKPYKVINGKCDIDGLNEKTRYQAFLYAKINGEMVNLFNELYFTTSTLKPSNVLLEVYTLEGNNKKVIKIKYIYDHGDGIKETSFKINNDNIIAFEFPATINECMEIYDLIDKLVLDVTFQGSPDLELEHLTFDKYDINFSIDFIYSEIYYRNNNYMKSIFNND